MMKIPVVTNLSAYQEWSRLETRAEEARQDYADSRDAFDRPTMFTAAAAYAEAAHLAALARFKYENLINAVAQRGLQEL